MPYRTVQLLLSTKRELSMKKFSVKLISAILAGAAALPVFSCLTGTVQVLADETNEYALFPLRTMCVTQLAFESGNTASHGNSYHIDCSGKYEEYAVAPFTGKVVFTTKHYGLVLYQSLAPVHYADGSLDYMTVIFMHCANTDALAESCAAGTVFPQGADLIRCGGIGSNGAEEYVRHYDIGVFRGRLDSPADNQAAEGYYSRLGNIYPFEGLFVDPALTVNIVRWGALASGNQLTRGNYTDWQKCWVLLPDAETQAAEPAAAEPEPAEEEAAEKLMPEKPVVSVVSEDAVVISYQECENATYYNVRVYGSDHKVAYCVGVCADANPFNECRVFTDTSLTRSFEPGSYYVRVTAVNKTDGTCIASDAVPFEVKLPEYAGSGDLDGNTYVNAADVRLMVRCIGGNADLSQASLLAADMNLDGVISAADLSLLKRYVLKQCVTA